MDKVYFAQSGITDCHLDLDRAIGQGVLTGYDFVDVKDGVERPIVAWDSLRLGMASWSQGPPVSRSFAAPGGALRPRVVIAGPNPFRESVECAVSVRPGSDVLVQVIDVGGRVVREIYHGVPPLGSVQLAWNGTGAGGWVAPAGLYWVRARSAGMSASRSVVRLR